MPKIPFTLPAKSDPGKIGDRNQWWVHRAHGLAHWFKSHLTPSPPSAFPSWVPLVNKKVSANKLKQQAVKASYKHERQKYAETSQSIPSYSCPNGGIISSHYFPC
ncbi:unnamed protein product, partial [Vitis vinifera]